MFKNFIDENKKTDWPAIGIISFLALGIIVATSLIPKDENIYSNLYVKAETAPRNNVVIGALYPTAYNIRQYKYAEGVWNEINVASSSGNYLIYALDAGDADNDGKNEVVAGIFGEISDDLRIYDYDAGVWSEKIIADTPARIYDLAIGDVDNDGKSEVAVALSSSSSELIIYKLIAGYWYRIYSADLPTDALAVTIGDADNDGQKEIVVGLNSTSGELRLFKYTGSSWEEKIIADTPAPVLGIAVGDGNNDGQNEIIIGMGNTTGELRSYQLSSGVWNETTIADIEPPPFRTTTQVNTVTIGDADNDGKQEVVVGIGEMGYGNNGYNTRLYKYESGAWQETDIGYESFGVFSIKIGDADNDGQNEIVRGMEGTGVVPIIKMYKYSGGAWQGFPIKETSEGDAWSVVVGDFQSRASPTPTPTSPPTPSPTPTATPTPSPTPTIPTSTPTLEPTPSPTPLDTTPPTVSITYPIDGSTVNRNILVTISASASDTSGIARVEFYVNNTMLCNDTTYSYSCPWKVPSRKGISYTLQSKAYDTKGNSAINTVKVISK